MVAAEQMLWIHAYQLAVQTWEAQQIGFHQIPTVSINPCEKTNLEASKKNWRRPKKAVKKTQNHLPDENNSTPGGQPKYEKWVYEYCTDQER